MKAELERRRGCFWRRRLGLSMFEVTLLLLWLLLPWLLLPWLLLLLLLWWFWASMESEDCVGRRGSEVEPAFSPDNIAASSMAKWSLSYVTKY